MKYLALILALFSTQAFSADSKAAHVDSAGAEKLIAAEKVQIVDVRTKDEFIEGHLKGAKNIDILEPTFEAELAKLDKAAPVLVHCQAGGRSTRSLAVFEKLGFSRIIHLDGGYGAWVEAGKPTVK